LFILLFIMITSRLDIKISTITKRIILLLFTVISLLTIYAISGDARVYTLGNLNVGGVQGRYYYAALLFLPVIVSEPLNKLLNLADKESTEYPCAFMQYSIAFLNVLTLGIALYTQITKV
jgi:Predicted membrane protein